MYRKQPLESLCRDLRNGTVSAAEIREQALSAEARLKHLNCFIRDGDAEEQFSKASDAFKGGALWGIPVSFKDNICVKDLPVTAGTPGMTGCIATHDAFIVKKLKSLGVVVAGKNNMHELSFGITSVNVQWGTAGNPAAPGYCAGGSSGGCAAAVAAGIVPVSVGTDTGGSVRIPAAFCGIAGFRPTTGRWASSGIIPVSHTKDAPGLLTRTVKDAAFLYGLISGSNTGASCEVRKLPCRVGLPASLWTGLDDHVKEHSFTAIRRMQDAGFDCVELDDGGIYALNETLTFTIPLYEFFTDFPRALLGLGWEQKIDAVFSHIADPHVRKIIHAHLAEELISRADYASAVRDIGRLRLQMNALFSAQNIGLLAYPTSPCQVPPLSHVNRPELFAEVIRNTDLASNAALPSVSLPVAPPGALPVGLSFDAPTGQDLFLLKTAAHIEMLLATSEPDIRTYW
ncbi:amidase family protein [Pantoea agglomerans]|uniref:amidase family protein n=1 Tax=Enterobacter agglomerans TaxID=549 RepID=UPI0007E5B4FC|nr:amidase family protein [Pantoea agglomerans]WHU90578.1 amidase family protein [Pantoea agglomerans pv. gypsophilae]